MKKVISILLTVLMVAVCIPFAETNASTNQNPTFVMKKENWGLQKWGELSFADNAVTASAHFQSLYTTVDGFEPNTKYSLSFNVSAGDKITRTWVIEPGEDLSKAECWVNANSGTYNGTKTDLTVPGTFFTKDYSTKDKTTGEYKEGGLGSAYKNRQVAIIGNTLVGSAAANVTAQNGANALRTKETVVCGAATNGLVITPLSYFSKN